MTKIDRLQHLASVLRARRSITLAQLQDETGVSRATLMRDLAWLRDELGHPIHWDRDARCYLWRDCGSGQDAPEEIAGLWFKPSEVLALLTLEQLLRDIQPGDFMQRQFQPLHLRFQKILSQAGLDTAKERQWGERVRVVGLGQRPVSPQSFETVGWALSQRRQLSMRYLARGSGQASERTVSPQRLVYYRSNWMLDAWCHKRNELRSFSLDAIRHPVALSDTAIDISTEEIDQFLGNGYGIFGGKNVQWATLRFTPERARWVAAELWHPQQQGHWDDQNHWVLQIPYSDERELVMDILRHIPEVEVLEPQALRDLVMGKMREGLQRWSGVA